MSKIEEYNQIFVRTFSLEEKELNDEIAMGKTHDWDSMGHVKLITTIEDAFDIMLESKDILDFTSYKEGKEILRKYGINL